MSWVISARSVALRAAKTASEAATSAVLEFFADPKFKSAMQKCCSEIASLSPQELLERYRAEARVAELTKFAEL